MILCYVNVFWFQPEDLMSETDVLVPNNDNNAFVNWGCSDQLPSPVLVAQVSTLTVFLFNYLIILCVKLRHFSVDIPCFFLYSNLTSWINYFSYLWVVIILPVHFVRTFRPLWHDRDRQYLIFISSKKTWKSKKIFFLSEKGEASRYNYY